ncbi:MAG: cation transporter [Bacteroidota bacterium]|jgi:copper chaperone CopZ|nr:cation transporter [Bacteroidota bacterium]
MKKGLLLCCFLVSTLYVLALQTDIKQDTIGVRGNCSMCKERIEEACYVPGVKKATWNARNQTLVVIYKPSKVSLQKIVAQIALAGHDSDSLKASDASYKKLPDCCTYRSKSCPK